MNLADIFEYIKDLNEYKGRLEVYELMREDNRRAIENEALSCENRKSIKAIDRMMVFAKPKPPMIYCYPEFYWAVGLIVLIGGHILLRPMIFK